jgi:hypothetical protein
MYLLCRGDHEWRAPLALVGGLPENPGVWGTQHGSVVIREVCARCGSRRTTEVRAGRKEEVTVEPLRDWAQDADQRADVRDWLREQNGGQNDESWYA